MGPPLFNGGMRSLRLPDVSTPCNPVCERSRRAPPGPPREPPHPRVAQSVFKDHTGHASGPQLFLITPPLAPTPDILPYPPSCVAADRFVGSAGDPCYAARVASSSFDNLSRVRTDLLGYGFQSVARLSGITAERLQAIEAGSSPTVAEIESLSIIYGIEADRLCDEPIALEPGDAIEVLTCSDEFQELGDGVRARIVSAANAARDLRRLLKIGGEALPTRDEWIRTDPPEANLPPHRQGAALAVRVRNALGLGVEPIPSIRDLVGRALPGAHVLYASLGATGPAGITFADALRLPTIVLNLDGKNRNPAVRRFSLAHEMLHLLLDWETPVPLAIVSGFLSESALDRERRANAFAVRLLCPESVLRSLHHDDPAAAAKKMLLDYGLHYAAARLYLRNELGHDLPHTPPLELGALGTRSWLERAEAPEGLLGFPIDDVPVERRTVLALAAARCYSSGLLARDAFAEALGVTPAHDLEAVLDWFALPMPADEMVA